jgi:hypothetical protein
MSDKTPDRTPGTGKTSGRPPCPIVDNDAHPLGMLASLASLGSHRQEENSSGESPTTYEYLAQTSPRWSQPRCTKSDASDEEDDDLLSTQLKVRKSTTSTRTTNQQPPGRPKLPPGASYCCSGKWCFLAEMKQAWVLSSHLATSTSVKAASE